MASIDNIADTYFGCSETPIWLPNDFNKATITPCTSCTLRLNTPTHTAGTIYASPLGVVIEETPIAVLSVNGTEHNLLWTELAIPGAHRLSGMKTVADAELLALFRNPNRPDSIVYLCLPITIGFSGTNAYFDTLGKGVQGKRPALSTLVTPSSTFIMYTGASFKGRSAGTPRPTSECDPVRSFASYYVCEQPITMAAEDLERFKKKSGTERKGPPAPITAITPTRASGLCQRIRNIVVEGPDAPRAGFARDGGYAKSALKCYRLDRDRDVVGDKIYIGGKGKPQSLPEEDELTNAALNFDKVEPVEETSIQPGDIQKWLGIAVGILIGALLVAGMWWAVKRGMFNGSANADTIYTTPSNVAHT